MKIIAEELDGLLLIQPTVFEDQRGYFYESYHAQALKDMGITDQFVQDNQSLSNKGVLRGLHFQHPPSAQGKLVRVVKGAVYDVAVDLRKGTPTYGQHFGVNLNEINKSLFWIPPGFAHGFCTLEDHTIFSYKCTDYYAPTLGQGIQWDDAQLGINWPIKNPILSENDINNMSMESFNSPF